MTTSPHRSSEWAKVPAALALAISALGAVLAVLWGIVAGLWTFSTKDYPSFAAVLAVLALLVGTPLVGFRIALEGRLRLAFAVSLPALSLYGLILFRLLRSH